MVDLQRVVAIVQSVKGASDMEIASAPIIAILEERTEAQAETGRLAIDLRNLRASYEGEMDVGLDLEGRLYKAQDQLEALTKLAKRFIVDRGCTCNEAGHRCGTNQMIEDLEAIVGKAKDQSSES